MASSKEFRTLLYSLAHEINQRETDAMVWIHHLPKEYSGKSAVTVLQYMEQQGMFSQSKPEELIEVLKSIKKNDLCKQVKEFSKAAKKSRKSSGSSSSDTVKDQPFSPNFDSAEEGMLLVKGNLDALEESVKSCNVKRIEEVYNQARQATDDLLKMLKHANGLARSLLANRSEQTRPREISSASPGHIIVPMALASMCAEQQTQRTAGSPQVKTPPQETPPQGTPPKQVVRLNRSQSERILRPALPHLPYQAIHTHKEEEEEEDEDEHDYDEPYTFCGPAKSAHTLPRKTSDITKVLQHSPPYREMIKNPGFVPKQSTFVGSFSPSSSAPKQSTFVGSFSPSSSAPKQSTFVGPPSPNSSVLKQSGSILPFHLASPVQRQPPTTIGAYPCTNIQQIRESLRRTKEKYGPQAHPISVARAAETEASDYTDSSTGDSGFEEVLACLRAKNHHRPVPKPRNRKSSEHRSSQRSDYSPEVEEEAYTSGTVEPDYVNVGQMYHQ